MAQHQTYRGELITADEQGRECRYCLVYKLYDQFYASREGINGRRSICKACWRKPHLPIVVTGEKFCSICREKKPLGEFHKKAAMCKECRSLWAKSRKYGLSVDQLKAMRDKQGNRCVICRVILRKGKNSAVDHCHKSGKVRGMLCSKCNYALGFLRDNPDNMRRAIWYLESSNRPV